MALPAFHGQEYVELIMFVHLEVKLSRSTIKGHLDAVASAGMLVSILAKDCKEWSPNL